MRRHKHHDAIIAFAEGHAIEFRPNPDATNYGSATEWMPCLRPDFDPNFEYRIAQSDLNLRDSRMFAEEVERLNIIAKMHEGGD